MATLDQVSAACADEIDRFNAAVAEIPVPIVIDWKESLCKGHTVVRMKHDFWLVTRSPQGTTHSWCLCNDGRWKSLLQSASVPRNPLWA